MNTAVIGKVLLNKIAVAQIPAPWDDHSFTEREWETQGEHIVWALDDYPTYDEWIAQQPATEFMAFEQLQQFVTEVNKSIANLTKPDAQPVAVAGQVIGAASGTQPIVAGPAVAYDRWEPRTWVQILTSPTPKTLYVVDKLVVENGGTLISGLPHSMKSLSTLAGCLEVLVKKTFWGLKAKGIERVAYVETEDPRAVVEQRVRELSKGLGIGPQNTPQGFQLFCTGHLDLGSEAVRRELFGNLKKYSPNLIVLSTLQGMLGNRSWNKQEDMTPILSLIVRICLEVCPVILITHSPQDTTMERAIGTVAQAANFIVTVHLKTRKDKKVADLNLDSKLGDRASYTLKLQVEGAEVRGFILQKTSVVRADILALHSSNPLLSAEKIADRLGCNRQYVYKVLGETSDEEDPAAQATN